jgi:DNA-binding transcriptional MerR regulator
MSMMNISQAATAAGVTPKMIRHYESLALIPAAKRTESGYRLYEERDVEMLGFPIAQIDSLLRLWRDEHRESRDVKQLARSQLEELQRRRMELEEMSAALEALIAECSGDDKAHCPILTRLSAPLPARLALAPAAAVATLKEVKPGSRAQGARRPRHVNERALQPAHSALETWSRSAATSLQ